MSATKSPLVQDYPPGCCPVCWHRPPGHARTCPNHSENRLRDYGPPPPSGLLRGLWFRWKFRHDWPAGHASLRSPAALRKYARWIKRVPWRARSRWLWNMLTYPGEVCQDCGRKNLGSVGSFWTADDDLWLRVVGRSSGLLCPYCFSRRAQLRGERVRWSALV